MQHYILKNSAQFGGAYTDLFILGKTRAAAGASDFTAAATTQSYNLALLAVGDHVPMPLAVVMVKTAVAGLTTPKMDVGTTDDADQFVVGVNSDLATVNFVRASLAVSSAAGGAYSCIASSKYVTALITSGSENISTVTAGEVWIYAAISRVADMLRDRTA